MKRADCTQCGRNYPTGERGGHCTNCHQSFTSDSAFELHRTGPHPRTCLTPAQMLALVDAHGALKLQVHSTGWWSQASPTNPTWRAP
jgi:hypothetical protein